MLFRDWVVCAWKPREVHESTMKALGSDALTVWDYCSRTCIWQLVADGSTINNSSTICHLLRWDYWAPVVRIAFVSFDCLPVLTLYSHYHNTGIDGYMKTNDKLPGDAFPLSAQKVWEVIKSHKDLDLPAHKVWMLFYLAFIHLYETKANLLESASLNTIST